MARRIPSRQGHRESSPALQCWVSDRKRFRPEGTLEKEFRKEIGILSESRSLELKILSFVPPGRRLSRTVYPAINCWATFTTSLEGRDCPRLSFTQLLSLCSRSTEKRRSAITPYIDALIGAEMSCESASGPSKDFPLRIPLEYPTFVRAA